jgi:hypothetical protein
MMLQRSHLRRRISVRERLFWLLLLACGRLTTSAGCAFQD